MHKKVIFIALIWIVVTFAEFALYRLREVSPVSAYITWAVNNWVIVGGIIALGGLATGWIWKHDFNKVPYYNENAKRALSKHWDDLAILSEAVASKMSLPFAIDNRYLSLADGIDKEEDGIHALMFINHWAELDSQTTIGYVDQYPNADWSLYPHLHTHLKAEDSQWGEKLLKLQEVAVNLHIKLHKLSQITNSVTTQWQIFLETDWRNHAIFAGEASSKVLDKVKPMEEDVTSSCRECISIMKPIQDKLNNVARRRTFKGKCAICSDL